ncbi:uroporphyrinogen-III C-methyltransferase [Glaciecola siphonariae]|uniref:Uroporphyrinogen-III C-methyltransferase n=1 Tax=Glaciecola siphonariae TaxID=521012 RepID=A0ABV9LZ80_9ALTE
MTKANESKSVATASTTKNIEDGVVIDSQKSDSNEGTSNNSSSYQAKKHSSSSKDSDTQKKHGRKALWFFILLNFLFILLMAAAGYWYYLNEQNTQSALDDKFVPLNNAIASSQRALDELRARIEQNTQELESSAQSNDNLLAQMLANNEALKAVERQVSEVSGRRPSDWLLAEANYLVNMAGRKLYLEQDLRTSMTLLREADARLQDLNDPSLLPIRALIASDIQALSQVNPVSTTSIALAISGLLPQVSQLPLENLKLPEAAVEEDAELSNDIADWQDNLKRTWRAIVGDFISIKRVEQPLSPYLSERQQWLIEQQLKHALTQAKSAALDEQYTLYQTALQQAMALIIEHYKIDENEVNQFMNALQQLQSTNFERDFPKQLSSVEALKDAIERRMERQFNNRDDVL